MPESSDPLMQQAQARLHVPHYTVSLNWNLHRFGFRNSADKVGFKFPLAPFAQPFHAASKRIFKENSCSYTTERCNHICILDRTSFNIMTSLVSFIFFPAADNVWDFLKGAHEHFFFSASRQVKEPSRIS